VVFFYLILYLTIALKLEKIINYKITEKAGPEVQAQMEQVTGFKGLTKPYKYSWLSQVSNYCTLFS
jgi:hypothetical protein